MVFYASGIVGSGAPGVRGRLLRLPAVVALGLGMAVSQSGAVFQALTGPVGTFVRTPKAGGVRHGLYRVAAPGLVGVKLALALYLAAACAYAAGVGYVGALPFLLLFAVGYGVVGLSTVTWRPYAQAATAAGQVTHQSQGTPTRRRWRGSNADSTR